MDWMLAEWKRFLKGLPPEGSLCPLIVELWGRGRAAWVDPEPERLPLSRVAEGTLQRRWPPFGM